MKELKKKVALVENTIETFWDPYCNCSCYCTCMCGTPGAAVAGYNSDNVSESDYMNSSTRA